MKHHTLQSHYLKLIFVFIQFKEALKPSKSYRPRHELDPDHDHTERERQNVWAVVPEIVQESTEMQEYYLNPIHVTETNGMRREADQGHLQTGIRNPNFQNDLQEDLPPPCSVSPQRSPEYRNENAKIDEDENVFIHENVDLCS